MLVGKSQLTALIQTVTITKRTPQDESCLNALMGVAWCRFARLDTQQFDGFAILAK